MKKNEIIWINSGWQPVWIGYCPNKKAWDKFVKKQCDGTFEYPDEVATCNTFDNPDGGICCVVCINLPDDAKPLDAYSYLVHEVVHVWQRIKAHIGETNPSPEFEAYSIQYVALDMWKAYDKYKEKYG